MDNLEQQLKNYLNYQKKDITLWDQIIMGNNSFISSNLYVFYG